MTLRYAPVTYRITCHGGQKIVRGYAVDSPEMVCVRREGSRWVADHWPTGYSIGFSAGSRDKCALAAISDVFLFDGMTRRAIAKAKSRGHYPANPMP